MSDKNNFQFTSKNCWTDGSGFEFDGEPFNLIGFTPNSEQFFSLTGKLAKNNYKKWNLWSNWIDKFQTDYRFLLLSDENAETILQPNVDDPWMFTEYIFKGIGKTYNSETKSMEEVKCLIVEPPLFDEESLVLKNPDRIFPEKIKEEDYDKFTKFDIKNECAKYNRNRIISGKNVYVKACRTINPDGWGDGYPVNDPGVKLYKVSVNVESVKWGEHGNIPPHTLNMYSPSSWLDTKTKKTIQPVTVAKIGYPVYATKDGVFYHNDNNNDYIVDVSWREEKGEGNLTKFYYDIPNEGGDLQPKGQAAGNASKNEMNLKYIQQSQNGDFIHKEGCEFFVGKGGCAYCSIADSNDMNFTNSLRLERDVCAFGKESNCPKFIKNSPKAISTYETVAQSKDQYLASTYGMYASSEEKYASNFLLASDATGPLLGGVGALLGAAVLGSTPTVYQPGLKDYTESNVYFETSFKFIETPEENFKITPENPQGFGKGVKVERGSGNQNIDNIIPWKGGDSYAVGDANQINFPKFTQSVMPCYNPDYCNEMCGIAMQSGYFPDSRANSKNQNSPETNSEYIDYCRYYKSKNKGVECPFDSVPKTAYEFQQAQILGKEKIEEELNRWIGNYNSTIELSGIVEERNTMFVKKIDAEERGVKDNVPEHYILYGKKDFSSNFGGLNCSQTEKVKILEPTKIKQEDGSYKTEYVEKEITAYKICKFTLTSINPAVAKIDDLYFWWTTLDNEGNKIIEDGKEVIWFCKFEDNIAISTHFTHYVDNWNKFIGGFHPQYKNYSLRGGEYIQEKESQTERDAMGDLGGDPEYSGIEQPKTKQGYWIDEDGEWIMDELDLGESLLYKDDGTELDKITKSISKLDSRGNEIEENFSLTKKEWEVFSRKNERENTQGVSLSFRKSNTIIGEDGQVQGPQTTNCTININDTKSLVEALYFSPPVRFDDKEKPIPMPPSVSFLDGLPAERMGAYCSVCNYYLNEKYGASNSSEDEGLYCPWCGNKLVLKPLKKLHKIKAIGQVDYWGLPGTVIDSKSYFWKTPALINNAMLDQIKFKAKDNGSGAWKKSEITNGYTKDFKGYYKPIPSKEEVSEMPESERKQLWELVKDNDRKDISAHNDLIDKYNVPSSGFDLKETDDRLIVPYSDTDGLKFFTLNHLKKLRKSVEPAMGYLIGTYRDNPDYNRLRPTYENRNDASAPRYWIKGKCGVKPQILAANTAGNDCYVQYWSGDPERGSVRDYYPPGATWWMLNNVMGIRYSDSKGPRCHLDDGAYGNETHSMMCCFLHGFVPLNKKILAAYAIIYPTTDPAREPLGRDWNGRVHYEHYHAFSKIGETNNAGIPHESLGDHLHKRAGFKECVFDNVGDMIPWSAVGQGNENLYIKTESGWIPGAFTSENKNSFYRMKFDENGVPHYVPKRPVKKSNFMIENKIGEFKDDGRYPEWLSVEENFKVIVHKNTYQSYYDFGEEEMLEATSDLQHFFDDGWWGKLEGGLPVWDYIKLEGQYEGEIDEEGNFIPSDVEWSKFGKNIIQLKTNNEMWKQLTTKEFEEYVEYNTGSFNFSCTDGEVENSYDFLSVNQNLVNDFFPEQMQEIPGYFNYNGMNSAGYQNANIQTKVPEIDEKWKNEQILYQDDSTNSRNNLFGKSIYKECGNVPQILDITKVVKNAYSKRMDCEFICEAGKSWKENRDLIQNREESKWEGIGEDFNPEERKIWNKRMKQGDTILLSDCYHYPKLNAEGKIISSNDGEKIELNHICESDIFQCKNIFPKSIDKNNDKVIIRIEKDTESIELEISLTHKEKTSFNDYCKEIETKLNEKDCNCKISVFKNQRWNIKVENCYSFELKGNAIAYLGVEKNNTFNSVANRVVSYTSCLEGFNPINLLKGDDNLNPIKNNGWKTESFVDENQNFIIDLCQTPFENSRRDWRYRSGSVNCTNCYCPNENCITNLYYHPKKVTVGNFAAKKNIKMGDGQTTCPFCGTDLSNASGAVAINSDGIKSYYYDEFFDYNPLIIGCYIKPSEDELFKSSFNIYLKNTETGVWICVFKAIYNPITKKFTYWKDKNGGVEEIKEGANAGKLAFLISSIGDYSNKFTARYVKVETFNTNARVFYTSEISSFKENLIILDEHTEIDTDALIGQVIRFSNYEAGVGEEEIEEWNIEDETIEDYRIISNYIQDNKLVIKLDKFAPKDISKCAFYANVYRSGIGCLEFYGLPFKNSDFTILPPADFESGEINSFGMSLSQQPIQIMNVYAGSLNGGMITLTEIEENEKDKLFFETNENVYLLNGKQIKYYEIKSGTFFHEPKTNKIYAPTLAKINGELKSIEYLTKELEENGIYLKGKEVNQMIVEYWNASHPGITLQASAKEMGPAYQLESESICKIKNPEELPECGKSVRLFTSTDAEKTERKDIEWFCYNHIPSTMKEQNQMLLGGYFKKPNFYGMELGQLSGGTATKFKSLFGDHCTKISPRCFTEVTFYGRPNSVLSGNIEVYAPKENKITYQFPYSENLTITEKTGGLADGMFVLEIKKGSGYDKGRKTKAWSEPLIVVYAEDDEPFSSK